MSAKRISQREAHALKRRVVALETTLRRLRHCATMESSWASGQYIATEPNTTDAARTAIVTARRLKHAVFVDVLQDEKAIRFFAVEVAR